MYRHQFIPTKSFAASTVFDFRALFGFLILAVRWLSTVGGRGQVPRARNTLSRGHYWVDIVNQKLPDNISAPV